MNNYPPKDQFSHSNSPYERPTHKYRCGRAPLWGKPCARGPSAEGSCQGSAECRPVKSKNDRWICRRSGGSCAQGPLPDGTCCNTQPPCAPVVSTRVVRGRTVVFCLLIASAVLSGLVVFSELQSRSHQNEDSSVQEHDNLTKSTGTSLIESNEESQSFSTEIVSNNAAKKSSNLFRKSKFSILSPGKLSDVHTAFVGQDGCNTCHLPSGVSNNKSGLLSAFRLSSISNHKPLSEGCISCHTFGGPTQTPHNFSNSSGAIECQTCHNEHKGRFAELTQISNQQCANCHKHDFTSFKSHPQFSDNFPYDRTGSIVFDHSKHLKFHFDKAKNKEAVPQSCTSCHNPEGAKSRVKIIGYDSSCSACHENNISASAKAELPLLSLPALKLKSDEALAAYKACGATIGQAFKGAGKSRSNPFTDWLLGFRLKKTDDYATAYCKLLQEMDSKGLSALISRIEDSSGLSADGLFDGLTPELISILVANWIDDSRYRPDNKKVPKGFKASAWFVTKKGDLNYRPSGHGDKTALAWLSFAIKLRKSQSKQKLATRFADSILNSDRGLGACTKCHLPSANVNSGDSIGARQTKLTLWSETPQEKHHRFKFDHSAHLRFVGAGNLNLGENGVGCGLCHQLNPESKYASSIENAQNDIAYESNFFSLRTETCSQCHNQQSIQDDCTLCHVYHESPGFTPKLNRSLGGNYESN